jgi:hypothetical protein
MELCPRRYWVMRTDKENRDLLWAELCVGRLRQGWGYSPSQDLRLIQAEITEGGKWWDRLTIEQKEVLPQLKMLQTSDGGVRIGDWIIVPNLPEHGPFLIVEVTGYYDFSPMDLTPETDLNSLGQDYGHILPVRLLTEAAISRYSDAVDAKIRSTLKTPMRMWNADGYAESIDRLMLAYRSGVDLGAATAGSARLDKAWQISLYHAANELEMRLGAELDSRFQAAEWEEPIKLALESLYPSALIRWVGGPQERGADVIVQMTNHFGGRDWLIIIQVKNYVGEIGADVLRQLITAYGHYSTEGSILSLVVMTTAERMSAELMVRRVAVEEELQTPIAILLRKETIRLLSNGLLSKMNGSATLADRER